MAKSAFPFSQRRHLFSLRFTGVITGAEGKLGRQQPL